MNRTERVQKEFEGEKGTGKDLACDNALLFFICNILFAFFSTELYYMCVFQLDNQHLFRSLEAHVHHPLQISPATHTTWNGMAPKRTYIYIYIYISLPKGNTLTGSEQVQHMQLISLILYTVLYFCYSAETCIYSSSNFCFFFSFKL